jgi:hypothetical protein
MKMFRMQCTGLEARQNQSIYVLVVEKRQKDSRFRPLRVGGNLSVEMGQL